MADRKQTSAQANKQKEEHAPKPPTAGCVEMETLRFVTDNVEKYREHLERQFALFRWCIGAVCVVAIAIIGFLVGNTYWNIPRTIRNAVRDRLDDERFFEQVRVEVERHTDASLVLAASQIREGVNRQVRTSLQTEVVGGELAKATRAKIDEIKTTPVNDILKNALLPLGVVLPYTGRLACEGGADPTAIRDAYDGGLPIWPEGSSDWIVCNGATLTNGSHDASAQDANPNVAGFQVLDLRGRFAMGMTGASWIGTLGGSESHVHPITVEVKGVVEPIERIRRWPPDAKSGQAESATYAHYHEGKGEAGPASNLPPYFAAVYVTRVR